MVWKNIVDRVQKQNKAEKEEKPECQVPKLGKLFKTVCFES